MSNKLYGALFKIIIFDWYNNFINTDFQCFFSFDNVFAKKQLHPIYFKFEN